MSDSFTANPTPRCAGLAFAWTPIFWALVAWWFFA
mgnify:CR=1 FL=1